jgi:hypothetical protein
MFQRMANGWALAKQSFQVLKLDKELLLFPMLSGLACLLVLASFAVPLIATGALQNIDADQEQTGQRIVFGIIAFAYYFVNYFVIVFFNSALVGCAVIRLKGGNPTVGDGFGAAMARLPQIAGWALVAATVGLILKAIESRSNRLGQFVVGLLGMAWSITTFFVVPVLVIERVGPIEAIRRSVSIVKQTWGESLTANVSIGIITFLVSMLCLVPIGLGVMAIGSNAVVLGIVLCTVGVIWLLLVSLVSTALHSITLAAIYIYAAEGKVPDMYDRSLIEHAFSR